MVSARQQEQPLGVASLVGVGVGLGVLGIYVAAGLVVANWSVEDFLANLDGEVLGVLVLVGGVAVACFAVPVAAYLRYRLVSPLVVLVTVVLGWLGYGAATGVLTSQTVFGLAVYAMYLAPVYFLLYAVFGGLERYVHR
ncbi:hypothetical protein [Halobacterium wangiae]|uniref:hypothetical protein n=1 Tax=Halobacterium wangiae TaxID=2902623 RepID=UPI001E2F8AA9|nr:hypothetical protein [Halobacterium wangiae]